MANIITIHPSQYENLTANAAVAHQQQLKSQLNIISRSAPIQTIGGADISFNKYEETVYAGIIVFSYPDMKVLNHATVVSRTSFPYIPGLLAFREVPALMEVWEKLTEKPDILMLDGHGIAHPRSMGIAAHFGAVTGATTLGCAKSRLFGHFAEPDNIALSQSPLYDKQNLQIGTVLRSKKNCTPLFISPGNNIDMAQSVDVVINCLRGYRMPEPTRQAHLLVNKIRVAAGGGNPNPPNDLFNQP